MDGGSLNLQSAGRTFSHNAEKIFGRSILIWAKKTEFMIFGTSALAYLALWKKSFQKLRLVKKLLLPHTITSNGIYLISSKPCYTRLSRERTFGSKCQASTMKLLLSNSFTVKIMLDHSNVHYAPTSEELSRRMDLKQPSKPSRQEQDKMNETTECRQ
jgi:hypothetical protein